MMDLRTMCNAVGLGRYFHQPTITDTEYGFGGYCPTYMYTYIPLEHIPYPSEKKHKRPYKTRKCRKRRRAY